MTKKHGWLLKKSHTVKLGGLDRMIEDHTAYMKAILREMKKLRDVRAIIMVKKMSSTLRTKRLLKIDARLEELYHEHVVARRAAIEMELRDMQRIAKTFRYA